MGHTPGALLPHLLSPTPAWSGDCLETIAVLAEGFAAVDSPAFRGFVRLIKRSGNVLIEGEILGLERAHRVPCLIEVIVVVCAGCRGPAYTRPVRWVFEVVLEKPVDAHIRLEELVDVVERVVDAARDVVQCYRVPQVSDGVVR